MSNFAIAFAFIASRPGRTGTSAPASVSGGPAFFWTWPIVIAGQLLVALVFAELASHFPVAGSIYQWSKRLSNRTLGWFTGWFYFWAQVVTVSAVAVIVGYVVSGITGGGQEFLDSPSPIGVGNMHTFIALTGIAAHDADQRLRRPADVDPQQHRRRHRDPRHVRLRDHPAVLREPSAAERAVSFDGAADGENGNYPARSRSASSCPLSSSSASIRRARSARRPSTRAARRRVASFRRSSSRARRRHLHRRRDPGHPERSRHRWPRASRCLPDRDDHHGNLTTELIGNISAAISTCSSSWRRCSSARWPSRAPRRA